MSFAKGATFAALLLCMPFATSAAADDARSLDLFNMNTNESLTVVYKRNGLYDKAALDKLDRFFRDWRSGQHKRMSPRLYDALWEIRNETGSDAAIHVHSGYRTASTNSLLRKLSRAVAKKSEHMNGTAVDFHIPGVDAADLRKIALRLQYGGVGFYPRANNPFVHVDVGDVRHWPSMSRRELAAIFPDGMTDHIPSDGKPLKGFAEALVSIGKGESSYQQHVALLDFQIPDDVPLPTARPLQQSTTVASLDDVPFPPFAYGSNVSGLNPFSSLLAGESMGNPSEAVIRKPLAPIDSTRLEQRPAPERQLVDLGVGKKGDRLKGPYLAVWREAAKDHLRQSAFAEPSQPAPPCTVQ